VQANLEASGANVGIGIGSAFDLISGTMPRAPRWMQRLSLEWLFRMVLEPRRLGRRYLVEDSPFLLHLARHAARRALVRERS
jgi:N-acetylglucosaminyldiphosphoundecaprenol N-acetyl-beta-D-mannosaminyltransferase